jgi:phage shock protein B
MNVRAIFGIILLGICILLVGVVALHFFGVMFTPRPSAVHFSGAEFPGMPHSMAFETTHTVTRGFFSLFALAGLGLLVLILGGIGLILLLSGGASKGGTKGLNADETRIVQEIHDGLSRMEKRVESLETILLERPERSSGYPEALKHEE